jgi:spermidine synthase
MTAQDHLSTVLYETGGTYAIPVVRRLADAHSAYQRIVVVDTEPFGRCLLLDGVMQTAEADHVLYDDALLRRLRADDRRLLVIGGGDGYVARRAIERAPEARVIVVDIDPLVVDIADALLNPGFRADPRIEVRIADGRTVARALAAGSFDGIALDLTDVPVDPSQLADALELYRDMLALARPLVRPGGWLSVQGGPSRVADGRVDVAAVIHGVLRGHLRELRREDVFLPSYAERNAFFHGIVP